MPACGARGPRNHRTVLVRPAEHHAAMFGGLDIAPTFAIRAPDIEPLLKGLVLLPHPGLKRGSWR